MRAGGKVGGAQKKRQGAYQSAGRFMRRPRQQIGRCAARA